jgi:alkylhydroperoxidase/carboxymuconolactone decarboxylase family protein YurZ
VRGGTVGSSTKNDRPRIGDAFRAFMAETPAQGRAFTEMVQALGAASALDPKTQELVYIGILAVARLPTGLPFHVAHARALGATRGEIVGAVLAGLPAVGSAVVEALPAALASFDAAPD